LASGAVKLIGELRIGESQFKSDFSFADKV
jgi:hypothetical protein